MQVFTPPKDENTIPVVLCFSDNFVPYAYTTMLSALDHLLPNVKIAFYGMHGGISDEHLRLGQRLFNTDRSFIEFRDARPWFEGIQPAHLAHGTIFHFFRLAIPDFFAGFKRIIYADSDMLFLRCPSLFYHSMNDQRMLGGCRDILLKLAHDPAFKLPYEIGGGVPLINYHKGALGVLNSDNYINSGLLAFNIPNIPQEKIKELRHLSETLFWMLDQDILNRVFYGNICFMPYNWNVCVGTGTLEESKKLPEDWHARYLDALDNPFSIHFTGSPKPWHGWDGVYADRFRETLQRVLSA